MRRLVFAIVVVTAVVLCGCAVTVPGEPVAAGSSRASPKPLPFAPKIKDRTNDRNDGTTFEPCSAYSDAELRTLNINPVSIRDAPQVDSPNYRGCRWNANDYTVAHGGGQYSQIVGREMTLAEYKTDMNTMPWQPDRTVHGRALAVGIENNYCVATFRSEESIVTTIASSTNPSPGRTVECARAVAFASLAITKAP